MDSKKGLKKCMQQCKVDIIYQATIYSYFCICEVYKTLSAWDEMINIF